MQFSYSGLFPVSHVLAMVVCYYSMEKFRIVAIYSRGPQFSCLEMPSNDLVLSCQNQCC